MFAVVGALDRAAGRIAERMRANRLLGITGYRIKPEDNPRWLEVDAMKTMWRAGAEQRIAMCPLIRPEFIPSLDPMCRQFPETPVVIDHCARVDLGQDDRLQQLCALAKYPKVHGKCPPFTPSEPETALRRTGTQGEGALRGLWPPPPHVGQRLPVSVE